MPEPQPQRITIYDSDTIRDLERQGRVANIIRDTVFTLAVVLALCAAAATLMAIAYSLGCDWKHIFIH